MNINGLELVNCHSFKGTPSSCHGIDTSKLNVEEFRFIAVYLNVDNKKGIKILNSFQELVDFKKNGKLIYKFVELDKTVIKRVIIRDQKIILARNYYQLGGRWTVYINSKNDIVFREEDDNGNVGPNLRLSNKSNNQEVYYTYLACLYFMLNNTELTDPNFIIKEVDNFFQKL